MHLKISETKNLFLRASQLLTADKLSNFGINLNSNNLTEFFKYIWICEPRLLQFCTLLDVSSLTKFLK